MKLPLPPLAFLVRTLPDPFHAEALSRLANHLMKGQEIARRLDELDGRRICVAVTDAARAPVFRVHAGRIERAPEGDWDVRIGGRLEDLIALASRAEDPDTLFFQRRLTLEGDTATGLLLKNLLDALDFDVDTHCNAVLGPQAGRWAAGAARAVFARLPRTQAG